MAQDSLAVGEMAQHSHTVTIASKTLTGSIDTTSNDNENARRVGTGDATGILSSRENGSVFRYGQDGFVSSPTGITVNATHNHTATAANNGSNTAHNNIPPYVSVYMFRRTTQPSVGELASHSHTGSTNSAGAHSHTTKIGYNSASGSGYGKYMPPDSGVQRNDNLASNSAGNHSHTVSINNTGGNTPHNNIQPYISCHIWKRIA